MALMINNDQAFPNLAESDIRRYCTEQSFGRGEDYYERGAIVSPIRQGRTLRLGKPTIC